MILEDLAASTRMVNIFPMNLISNTPQPIPNNSIFLRNLEPVKDLKIDIVGNRSYSLKITQKTYSVNEASGDL